MDSNVGQLSEPAVPSSRGKTSYKNRKRWEDADEVVLLEIWRQNKEKLRGARKNSHVHMEMAEEMCLRGHIYTGVEVKVKIHNFTNKYRAEKKNVGPSGGTPSNWKHFEAVHQILGSYKAFNAELLVHESIDESLEYSNSSPLPPSPCSSIPPPSPELAENTSSEPVRKNKKTNQDRVLQEIKDLKTQLKDEGKEFIELQKKND